MVEVSSKDDETVWLCCLLFTDSLQRPGGGVQEWCGLNHPQLNVTKTKELVVDFRKQRARLNSVTIRATEVDIVDSYKYLGVHLDNKLDWTINTDEIYKKGQSHLFFLRRLRSFNVCRTMLQMFYHSVVSSIIFYAAVCWGSRLKTAGDTNRLNKLIRRPGSVLGVELESVVEVSERRMLRKLLSIMDNVCHLLHATLTSCQSSFLFFPSFLSEAIRLYKSSLFCCSTLVASFIS
ncbi:hypothetical protein L3Q82_005960 [Scortum barcoo]|uniref:Uncharacterized protein n=1 Tax=Scortum barcoo TaxID=214431 RepID=A0ACB8X328_9TELE|nr:hypothetical protein L3Q82_005960 [Scortum barcoo]